MGKISSSSSDHLEVDQVEEMLERAGNLGQFGPPPSANLARSVYFASLAGAGEKDGSSAGNAIATADAGHDLMSADQGDVLICLPSDYGNETVTLDTAGVHIFGFGLGQCEGVRFVMSADHVELAGFVIDYSLGNAHGIQIVNANHFWIHHNIIKDLTGAYDGIDKSAGGLVEGGVIEYNVITNCGGAGIGVVNFIENTIRDNWIYKNAAEGIIMNATCDNNRIKHNDIFENNEGLELQGDNNYILDNTIKGNIVLDIVDSGAGNRYSNTRGVIQTGGHTRTNDQGVGEINIITNVDTPRSGHVAVVIDTALLIDGGNTTFRVKDGAGNELASSVWVAGTTTVIPTLEFWTDSGANKFSITIQSTIAVAADRILGYTIIFGD